ncbi:DUF732 domain-containing protein [uncultured Mycolicibacterium sp.]|mgnify:CR=1 FL=1|uniref:DUF732 domain-containing protein n=1 Tax=uncultured Mycolicibacterium sp. TaxID=2320817 RepID=UPI00260E269D|nr:DUF732 domain-containing protein [uncultured Mycolicibacterium sp.]
MKRALIPAVIACAAIGFAAPAHADPDTDFANLLHTYDIYGQKDYNAWIGKIACKRLWRGVDADAFASAKFVGDQLPRHYTTEQAWKFLAAAIDFYCPDQRHVLQAAAEQQH